MRKYRGTVTNATSLTKKLHRVKPTKKQLKVMRAYWKYLMFLEQQFRERVVKAERDVSVDTGIKDIEFFMSDGAYVGIGNVSRTMRLIHDKELEKK